MDRFSSKQTFSSAVSLNDDSNSDEEFYEAVEDEEELVKFDIQGKASAKGLEVRSWLIKDGIRYA